MIGARIDLPVIGTGRRTQEWKQDNAKVERVKQDAEALAATKARAGQPTSEADARVDANGLQDL